LFYRYDQSLFEGTTFKGAGGPGNTVTFPKGSVPGHQFPVAFGGNSILNQWDNKQLDMGFAQAVYNPGLPDFSDPSPATEYNEKFPYSRTNSGSTPQDPVWGEGLLGIGNCGAVDMSGKPLNSNWTGSDINITYAFIPEARNNTTGSKPGRVVANQLCQAKTQSQLNDITDLYLSRIESARTGSIHMLLTLEQNPIVASTMKVGFVPWNTNIENKHLMPPESPVTVPGVSGVRFAGIRNKLLWINRADPSNSNSNKSVRVVGNTNIYQALETSRQQLMANTYGTRIMILLTDGSPVPNAGNNSTSALPLYCLNVLGYKAPESQRITLFTINLIGGNAALLKQMAENTPGGKSYNVQNAEDLKGVFEAIAYDIQRTALLNSAKRYNLQLD
jgi:hypothetical protein